MEGERRRLADTKEFLALWNAAKEDHFVQELAPLLPQLEQTAEGAARHIVRALHLASTDEGGVAAGMDYLAKVVE
jgi:hypothetical protein